MSCHDNAVAESFFSQLKGRRVRHKIYKNSNKIRSDMFKYIELFYNPRRRHSNNNSVFSMVIEVSLIRCYIISIIKHKKQPVWLSKYDCSGSTYIPHY